MRFFVPIMIIALALGSVNVFAKEEAVKEAKSDVKVEAPKATDPVVTVNGTVITVGTVNSEIDKRTEVYKKRAAASGQPMQESYLESLRDRMRENVLNMLVESELIAKEMKAKKLTITDAEIEKEIADIAAQNGKTVDEIVKEVQEKMFMSMDDMKDQIRMGMSIQKIVDAEAKDNKVSEEEAKKFFDDNPQYFSQSEQVKASHILVKFEDGASDEDKAKLKKQIEGILKEVKGGKDFAELAKTHSACPSGKNGGDLGFFGHGQMVKPFEEAAFSMKIGDISEIIETKFGYHIIKVTDKKEASKQAFTEVKDKIIESLEHQKRNKFWGDYIAKVKANAKIEYSPAEQARREAQAKQQEQMMKMFQQQQAQQAQDAKDTQTKEKTADSK